MRAQTGIQRGLRNGFTLLRNRFDIFMENFAIVFLFGFYPKSFLLLCALI